MLPRPGLDMVMMGCALALSHRATCQKRSVGCVLTDAKGFVLSTGYNGVARGLPHCIDHGCGGENQPSGSDTCQAIHAEINALIRCKEPDAIHTCYTTLFPCNNCLKSLLNTSCQVIVYMEDHPDGPQVRAQWLKAGRSVKVIENDEKRCV